MNGLIEWMQDHPALSILGTVLIALIAGSFLLRKQTPAAVGASTYPDGSTTTNGTRTVYVPTNDAFVNQVLNTVDSYNQAIGQGSKIGNIGSGQIGNSGGQGNVVNSGNTTPAPAPAPNPPPPVHDHDHDGNTGAHHGTGQHSPPASHDHDHWTSTHVVAHNEPTVHHVAAHYSTTGDKMYSNNKHVIDSIHNATGSSKAPWNNLHPGTVLKVPAKPAHKNPAPKQATHHDIVNGLPLYGGNFEHH